MKRLIPRLAAVMLATTVLTAPQLATAQSHHDYRYGGSSYYEPNYHKHHRGNDAAVGAVAGLVVGTLIGSALSSHNRRDYRYSDDGYYSDPRYGSVYGDARFTSWQTSSRYAGYDRGAYGRPQWDEDCDDYDYGRRYNGRGGNHWRHHHDDDDDD